MEGGSKGYAFAPVLVVSKPPEWKRYARRALLAAATIAVVACVALAAKRHLSQETESSSLSGTALGGAYYAVTKPPAFNFNREPPCTKSHRFSSWLTCFFA